MYTDKKIMLAQSDKALFLQPSMANRHGLIAGATGTGKTISAIYPAVQAMGNGLSETIFYLTARTIARTVAEDTFGLLQDKGLAMKVITLTAKEKVCVLDKVQCSPEYCPRAKGPLLLVSSLPWSNVILRLQE